MPVQRNKGRGRVDVDLEKKQYLQTEYPDKAQTRKSSVTYKRSYSIHGSRTPKQQSQRNDLQGNHKETGFL